ncbi:MAG: phytoene/squalene synthase family protein [Candidatus Thalassarchaeaceae archaeon]|jgi:farnesyl-diphosphate farnesyltransferase|nr:phytoene/squalene synthase family protein [Candidatus Thalassarchaeaceae archaeon]MDP7091928.1 phytoene/squalene synthase family protein [Candidatus Thalassarchaeaceae archaeon]MDP7256848.1 phytoene/squalene synthase family protein [Candidatus Thalassarchaeaceae archaeon]MDP7446088.1 phytoene/squalene synthase family protein [Candidatus Thalassarchaeaceae archaeon]MDP7649470.1 phytoene/squalene synthase family protein [Candidatus Thalassarchaeaceae archaeon]|tara:strand:- start:1221 stop:2234 length:1014 start_codon:yes stop_codon:yes gene_type:complete
MPEMLAPDLDSILEGTSRSFYLTLKLLPSRIRPQVGLLYLLARTSDTIADSENGSTDQRLQALEQFNERIQERSSTLPDLVALARLQSNPAEAKLLESADSSVECMRRFPSVDQQRIQQCLDIIISGQNLDLRRFADASGESIIALSNEGELDDYAYRVAGSVGEFWTHISLEHLFEADAHTKARLFETGARFGKALQLINILRDIPEDLRLGRCYLPSEALSEHGLSPSDLLESGAIDRFRTLFDEYIDKASSHLDAAVEYITLLPHRQFRLRGACMMPVLIGQRTLRLLRNHNVLEAESRIKVLRPEIKRLRNRTILALPFSRLSQKLLDANRSP